MNFSDLTQNLLQLHFQDLLLWKMNTASQRSALYSLIFFVDSFHSAVSSWSAAVIIRFSTYRERLSPRRKATSVVLVVTTFSCFTDIHHLRICRRIRLDYTRQPSLQTFRSGCLVNYTLSLSNADPAYRNKGRSAGAPHERWDERWLLMNSALSTSRLFPIYHH